MPKSFHQRWRHRSELEPSWKLKDLGPKINDVTLRIKLSSFKKKERKEINLIMIMESTIKIYISLDKNNLVVTLMDGFWVGQVF